MNIIDLLAIKINELQIEIMIVKAEFAETKTRLENMEATVNHER